MTIKTDRTLTDPVQRMRFVYDDVDKNESVVCQVLNRPHSMRGGRHGENLENRVEAFRRKDKYTLLISKETNKIANTMNNEHANFEHLNGQNCFFVFGFPFI